MVTRLMHWSNLRISVLRIFIGYWIISEAASAKGDQHKKPQQIKLEVINSTSIRIEWRHPRTGSDCPIANYVIRVKSSEVETEAARTWKFDATHTTAMVNDLEAGREYLVRVAAEHCDGKEKSSKWLEVRTQSEDSRGGRGVVERETGRTDASRGRDSKDHHAPGQPTNVRTRPDVDSLFVSWQAPEGGAIVRGYMIGYGEGVPDVNWQYLEAHRRNVTIKNLKRLTQYVVSVRAFNNYDQGPVVYDLVYTTDAASGATYFSGGSLTRPNQVRTRVLSPTSIRLQWVDPSLGRLQQITDNRYYNIHYEEEVGSAAGKTMSIIVKDLSVVLENLLPATRYEFKIRAIRDGQMSLFSEIVSSKTHGLGFGGGPVSFLTTTTEENTRQRIEFDHDDLQGVRNQGNVPRPNATGSLKITNTFESGSLVKEPSDGKSKRGSFYRDVVNSPATPLNGSVKFNEHGSSSASRAAADRSDAVPVSFHSLVTHRIMAYVTWPEDHVTSSATSCTAAAARSKVIGYRFRYKIETNEEDGGDRQYIVHTLSDNFIVLENLLPDSRYTYQVKYLMMEGDKETAWSAAGTVSTSYDAHAQN